MQGVEVSSRVWQRLLAVRGGEGCVCCGTWSPGEQAALDLYGPLARRDVEAMTVGQIGQSLDGRIATTNGDVGKVSGPDGLAHLHRMRALVDGVVIGVRTALHDAPRLTVRLCEGANPARIVIDPAGRLPDDSPVLQSDGARRIVIQAVDTVRPGGVEVIQISATDGQIPPASVASALRAAGLSSLLIEGGSFTLAKFMEAELLDRLHVAVAPIFIGAGPLGLTMSNRSENLADAIRPDTRVFPLGEEIIYDCGLSRGAAEAQRPRHGN